MVVVFGIWWCLGFGFEWEWCLGWTWGVGTKEMAESFRLDSRAVIFVGMRGKGAGRWLRLRLRPGVEQPP
eukprot:1083575-Amorphochlora_amoeboformis.AAC.1